MHHLTRHFRKSSAATRGPTFDNKPGLPTELLILISFFVRQRRDLVTLCRVSKQFRSIYTPLLYRFVAVDTSTKPTKFSAQLYLYKTLQDHTISRLVTHLEVNLNGEIVCEKLNKSSILPSSLKRCSCKAYDEALGRAVVFLKNLESLTMYCTLCSGSHTHEYLFGLEAALLRQFRFHCYGSSREAKRSILLLPFMPQVTALALECDENRLYPNQGDSHQTLVARPDVAPNLHTIRIGEGELSDHLLANRPIERLCFGSSVGRFRTHRGVDHYMRTLHINISQNPGKLSHLFAINILDWLSRAVKQDPEPYRYLRYIGTITIVHTKDARAFGMENLMPLRNLEVMEIDRLQLVRTYYTYTGSFNPDRRYFEILGDRHSRLRRVLLTYRHRHQSEANSITALDPVLWEKTDGQLWNSRAVPYLDYWDILHDKLDEV